MSLAKAVQVCIEKYACFDGRARRSEYWFWTLHCLFINLILSAGIIAHFVSRIMNIGMLADLLYAFGPFVAFICVVANLLLLVPTLAVSVRRLHDIGKSGWWVLLNLVFVFGTVFLAAWLCIDGHPFDNAYGFAPKCTASIDRSIDDAQPSPESLLTEDISTASIQ